MHTPRVGGPAFVAALQAKPGRRCSLINMADTVPSLPWTYMPSLVRPNIPVAFAHVGLDWHDYVTLDQRFVRPAEVDLLIGDRTKAEAKLGWVPTVGFEQLVQMMVDSDLKRRRN